MISHSSGVRSGDQFNVYIHDFYVVPTLVQSGKYEPAKGVLDKLTKEYIHQNLSYRFVSFQSEDSDTIVRGLEKQIQSGALGLSPTLNGKTYRPQNWQSFSAPHFTEISKSDFSLRMKDKT